MTRAHRHRRFVMHCLEPRLLLSAIPALTDADIGSPAMAGGASYNSASGTWTVRGGGNDIWNTADQFNFAGKTVAGNAAIVAQVTSETATNPYAKAGVMFRSDTSAGSAFADVVVTSANSVTFQWRSTAGGAASAVYANGIVTAPIWVMVTRRDNVFSGSYSYDGTNWNELGAGQTVTMNAAPQAGLAVCAVNTADLNTATFNNVNLTPVGWSAADIGGPSLAGSTLYDGSTFTVAGSGVDIWGGSDQFQYASQTYPGDFSIVAHIASQTNTGTYAKAGVMIRNGMAQNASYALLAVNPPGTSPAAGAVFQYRNGSGNSSQQAGISANVTAPLWVKLARSGNTFTAYTSTDGQSWMQLGASVAIAMSATANVGLAVSAQNASALCTATFDHVSVLPAGWSDTDIGSPAAGGSATFDGLTWAVNGGGTDIWNAADQFNLVSESYTGDVTLVAQVGGLLNTATNAKAGLMIRDGAAANASYAILALRADGSVIFEDRNGAGTNSVSSGAAASPLAAEWLKLIRSGNVFSAYYSPDDSAWTELGTTVIIPMSPTTEAGLAVDANSGTGLDSATFTYVSAGPGAPDPFLAQNGTTIRNGHGTGDAISLHGTNLGSWLMYEPGFGAMGNNGGSEPDTIYTTLANRFGIAGANRVQDAYEFNWITTTDMDDLKSLGFNVVRVGFSYLNLVEPDGTWRADAFTHLDWVVNEAAKRGIYVSLDFHGLPGGDSTFGSSGSSQAGAFWTSAADQQEGANIWAAIAAHFKGNPYVASYELMNEPVTSDTNALWNVHNWYYWTVRNIDPAHLIQFDAFYTWYNLPNPSAYGWTNIAYQTHVYGWDSATNSIANPTTDEVDGAVNGTISQVNNFASYNIPNFVGEFSGNGDPASIQYQISTYNQQGWGWTDWVWKNTYGYQGSAWSLMVPKTGEWIPDMQSDSLGTILSAYSTQTTAASFTSNTYMQRWLGMPAAVDDSFAMTPGQSLYVNPASGVLANDTDPNLGQSGVSLSTYLVSNVTHGSLTLWPDGSFNYTPAAGYVGTDTFRYGVWDGSQASVRLATASIVVRPNTPPAGWSDAETGSPNWIGFSSFDPSSKTWTVASNGNDFYGTADQFHFASESLTGDTTLTALVTSITNTNQWAKAGVMIRDGNAAGAAYASVVLTATNGVEFLWRSAPNAQAGVAQITGINSPVWLRLTRAGNTFSGFYSADDTHWTPIGTSQIAAVASTAQAGLAVTSANATAMNAATFTNVSTAASVLGTQLGDGSAQRSSLHSLQVTFNEPVNFGDNAYTLYEEPTSADGSINHNAAPIAVGGFGASSSATTATSTDGLTWTISILPGGSLDRTATVAEGQTNEGLLANGVFQLVLHGSAITDAATGSAPLNSAADQIAQFQSAEVNNQNGGISNYFHSLYGDSNGDGGVDLTDYRAFKAAYGAGATDASFNSSLDSNGDGGIDLTDYRAFKSAYGQSYSY